jgi:large subunit ribosomal protein L25
MKFVAYERTLQGTGASRRLRNAAKVPGIVYGAGQPQMIELDHNALFFALKKEAFHASLLEMELAGKTQKVLLRDFQMHAYKPLVLHIDFQRVDEKTKIHKKVPLHFVNEENSPAVKTDKCLISHVTTEVDIECLAAQLPEFIEVNLGEMVKGQSLHGKDLKLPAGVKLLLRGKKDLTVATATAPKEETEEAPAPAAVAAAPAAAKGKKNEKQNKK